VFLDRESVEARNDISNRAKKRQGKHAIAISEAMNPELRPMLLNLSAVQSVRSETVSRSCGGIGTWGAWISVGDFH
jgi:hypothetical protein